MAAWATNAWAANAWATGAWAADGVGDTTSPILTNASGTHTGATTALLSVDTDEGNGDLYLVVTESATQPTAAQIRSGNDDFDVPAVYTASQPTSSIGTKNFGVSGLTTSATYYGHFVHTDASTNNSNVITTNSFIPAAISTSNDIDTLVRNMVRSLVLNMVR